MSWNNVLLCHDDAIERIGVKIPLPVMAVVDERISGFYHRATKVHPGDINYQIITALRSAYLQGYADAQPLPAPPAGRET